MYNCSEFLEKNDDSMAAEIEQVLLRSTQPLIAAACAPPAVPETPAAEQARTTAYYSRLLATYDPLTAYCQRTA